MAVGVLLGLLPGLAGAADSDATRIARDLNSFGDAALSNSGEAVMDWILTYSCPELFPFPLPPTPEQRQVLVDFARNAIENSTVTLSLEWSAPQAVKADGRQFYLVPYVTKAATPSGYSTTSSQFVAAPRTGTRDWCFVDGATMDQMETERLAAVLPVSIRRQVTVDGDNQADADAWTNARRKLEGAKKAK